MLPLRAMGVLCCDQAADGRDAMATPEATVLSASRRENGVIAGECTRTGRARKTFSFRSRLSPHRRRSMQRLACVFLLVCAPTMAEDAMFRGNAQHTGVYAGDGISKFTKVRWQFQAKGPVLSSP